MISPALSERQSAALVTLGGMVSTVAHEVRNLLGPIDLYASLLAERCAPSPELAPLSGRLLSGVQQLRAVASNLLTVTRRSAIEAEPVDLRRLVLETVEDAALSLEAGIELRQRIGSDDVWVLGDAQRLRQAVLNLLLNAIQAVGEHGILTVALATRGDAVELTIRDTGVGMDDATLARATQAFFTTRPNGTGLGLAVVQDVTSLHQGRLTILSRPGAGTTVRMSLPRHDHTQPAACVPATARGSK